MSRLISVTSKPISRWWDITLRIRDTTVELNLLDEKEVGLLCNDLQEIIEELSCIKSR